MIVHVEGSVETSVSRMRDTEVSTDPSTCTIIDVDLLLKRKMMNEQQREEKQNRVSNFSHKTFV